MGAGSPLKRVGVGNAGMLVRRARQVEHVGAVQLGLAHELAQALAAQEARRAATRSLRRIPRAREAEVVSLMVALATGDEDAEVREAALGVLAKYWRAAKEGEGAAGGRGPGGVEDRLRPVLVCLGDADERVKLAALDTLAGLTGRRPPEGGGAAKMVLMALSHFLFPPSSPDAPTDAGTLGRASHYDYSAARLEAAAGGGEAVEASAAGADTSWGAMSQAVLAAAVKMLVCVAGADIKLVVRGALQALRHPEWHVRRAACRVLRALFARGAASPSASPTRRHAKMAQALLDEIAGCLRHADDGMRSAGVQAVAALCPPPAPSAPGLSDVYGTDGGDEKGGGGEWPREVADKVAAQLVHVASFRSEDRRRGVRRTVVSALLCLGPAPAASALRRVITSTSPAAASAIEAALALGVRPSGAAIATEGVAALAELSCRTVPGAREAAVRAAAVMLEASKGHLAGEVGGTATAVHMTIEQTLVLHRVALAQLVSVMTASHSASHAAERQSAAGGWPMSKAEDRRDEVTDRRTLERYTRGPWMRGDAKRAGSAGAGRVTAAAGSAVASTQRQDELRIELMMTPGLHESLYPPGHPYHKTSAAAAKGLTKFRAAMKKLSAVQSFNPAPKQAGKAVDPRVSFASECASIEASLLKPTTEAQWRLSRQQLERAEGVLEQRRRTADPAAARKEVQALEALLKRWEDKKAAAAAAAASDGASDDAGRRRRQEDIEKRTAKLKVRLQHAQARASASANAAAAQQGVAEAEVAVLALRAAAEAAQTEAAAVAAHLANASNKVLGRSAAPVGGGPEADAGDDDEGMEEELPAGSRRAGDRVVVRGVFLCTRVRGAEGQGGVAGGDGVKQDDDAEQRVEEGEEEERVEFVVCDFGCSPELHGQQREGDATTDAESVVHARFTVDDEACLTFSDKEGAEMQPLLANPVHLDSQVVNGKQLARAMAVCRMGRCAAAAKAQRARHADAKCLVISLDCDGHLGLKWQLVGAAPRSDGRELFHPQLALALASKTEFTQREWDAFGITDVRYGDFIKVGANAFSPAARRRLMPPASGIGSAEHIDLPVFCVARHDEGRLLSASSVRACLIPAGEEEGAQRSEEEQDKKKVQENVLEEVPLTRPKGSRELATKWGRWMNKVGGKV